MDNFDHEENRLSGNGGNLGTFLRLFLNGNDILKYTTAQISQVPNSLFPKTDH